MRVFVQWIHESSLGEKEFWNWNTWL